MNLYMPPHLPGPRRPSRLDELIERLLTGLGLVHAILKWITGSLVLLIAIIFFAVGLYAAWCGGGAAVDWIDVLRSSSTPGVNFGGAGE